MSYGGEQGNQISQIVNALGGTQGITKALGGGQQQAPTSFTGLNEMPRGSYQIPGYNQAPPPQAAPQAAPGGNRPQYSPNNPYGGLYANPQADAWEQQQRGGGAPPQAPPPMQQQSAPPPVQARSMPAAPSPGMGQQTMGRSAWAAPRGVSSKVSEIDLPPGVESPIVNLPGGGGGGGSSADVGLPPNGYGAGSPGGYYFSTAPSTLDPGSMRGLLGILGGSNWQGQANQYTQDYKNQYGLQAPGGPRAYWP
jgi:hypothetical protein